MQMWWGPELRGNDPIRRLPDLITGGRSGDIDGVGIVLSEGEGCFVYERGGDVVYERGKGSG